MHRKYEPIEYSKDDQGILTFKRSDVELEIPAEVSSNCMVYIGRGMKGRKVKIFLMRDKSEKNIH